MIENKEPHRDETTETRLTAAEHVAKLMDNGLYVYPYNYPTKEDTERKPRFIKGLIEHGHNDATNDKALIARLFEPNDNGSINYGVGANIAKSNLICLDFDNHEDSITGNILLKEMLQTYPKMAETAVERTPHGMHFYYQNDLTDQEKKLLSKNIENLDGLEVLTDKANIVPTKDYSEWGDKSLANSTPLPLPKKLHEYLNKLITGKVKAPIHTKPSEVNTETSEFKQDFEQHKKEALRALDSNVLSSRHKALVSYSGSLMYLGYDEQQRVDAISEYVEKHNLSAIDPKDPITGKKIAQMARYPEDKTKARGEVVRTIYDKYKERNLLAKSMLEIDKQKTTDKQVLTARLMAKQWLETHPDENNKKLKQLPYQVAADIMIQCFNIVRFSEDENSRVAIYVNDSNSSNYGLYVQNYDYLAKQVNEVRSSYSIKQINEVIRKIEFGTHGIAELYEDRNRIPVGNGIYNIDTQKLEPFTPDHIFITKVATNFNPKYRDESKAPNINGWTLDGWLYDLCKDEKGVTDKEVLTLLWQIIADAVNGNYSRDQAMFLYSEAGGSGKGSFITLVESIVGKHNYASANLEDIEQRFTMASLVNKSLCVGDENSGIVSKKTPNFKSLVTGDTVTVEPKNKNAYAARMNMLIIQCFNTRPSVPTEGGYWRRITYIPFRQKFYDEHNPNKEDKSIKKRTLKSKRVAEYALYKALTVYADFDRFIEPKICKSVKKQAQLLNDNVRSFISEEFDTWEAPIISKAALYEAYKRYCQINGFKALSKPNFVTRATSVFKDEDRTHAYAPVRTRINKANYQELLKIESEHSTFMYGTHEMNMHGKTTECFKRV